MSKTKKIAILAIIAMVLTLMPTALFAATADSTRLEGAGRVETALDIASAGWTTAGTVVLAPADQANLVDALAAAPLAGQENAPILLTFKGSLDASVKAKIAALGATKVYVVGAISDAVAAEVDAIANVTVEALKGAGRQATAAAVNAKLTSPAGTFVVGYDAIPDALSVASYAAKNKYAIVLANQDGSVDSAALVGTTKYIVGGTTKVKDIANVTRLSGADRYATNADVASKLSYSYDRLYVANGVSLVDALAVAPLAAKYNAFVALASGSDVSAASVVNAKLSASSKVIAVGGVNAVPATVVGKVAYAAPATFAVDSVTAVNLNTVKVVFTKEVNENNAENTANYAVDGANRGAADAAVLQADKKTVYVIMDAAIAQGQKAYFAVNSGLLSKDGLETSAKYEKELTFTDVAAPTVESVTVTGNKQLTVYFSEPVDMTPSLAGIKVDGVLATSFGANGVDVVNPGANGTTGDEATTVGFGKKIIINFGSAIPAGSHTLTMPAGTAGNYEDKAGFRLAEQTIGFTVASVTTAPVISSVTGDNNGIVWVQFDRDMEAGVGTNGAENTANYNIGGTAPTAAAFDTGSKSKVKLTFASTVVAKGANVLVIDKDIKDVYGNSVHGTDDQRVSFTAGEDKTKPTVESVSLSKNTVSPAASQITVKFAETVNYAYATNPANYTLKDADGNTVALTGAGAGIANSTSTVANDTTFIITLPTASAPLSKASYTLEIKNVVDVAATPNAMDTVTKTLTVSDAVAPTVTAFETAENNKVRVVYSEAMDSSVMVRGNYYYAEEAAGAGALTDADTFKALPASVTMAQIDAKTVELTFPGTMTVVPAATGVATNVIGLKVIGVKDASGNLISTGSALVAFTSAAAAPNVTIDAKTVTAQANSDKVWVTFNTNQILSAVTLGELRFGTIAPTSYSISGKTVTLNFTTNQDTIKGLGNAATLTTNGAPAATMTAEGVLLKDYSAAPIPVYENSIAPKVTGVAVGPVSNQVDITFSTPIQADIAGLYINDFTVESNGALVTVNSAAVIGGNVLRLTLASNLTATATVKAIAANIDVKAPAEGADYANTSTLYVPSTTDIGGRAIAREAGTAIGVYGTTTPGAAGAAEEGNVSVTAIPTTAGFATVKFSGGAITAASPVRVTINVITTDTTTTIAGKIVAALNANATFQNGWSCTAAGAVITITADAVGVPANAVVVTLE